MTAGNQPPDPQHLLELLAECREWMRHVEMLGYDRIDPTLRAAIDHELRGTVAGNQPSVESTD